jgi:FKBP-type peptidyl-prolyl cis-trans isomerase SlyD
MNIEKERAVSIIYELRESNSEGRIIETVEDNNPLTFIFGSGKLLEGFESNLNSLSTGESFRFILKSEMAYGNKREDLIINIPASVFEIEGKLDKETCWVGNQVPMRDSSGNNVNGTINEITDTYIIMDFNHPMAGVDLFFSGKILDVRQAGEDELNETVKTCSSCESKIDSGCSGVCG